MELATHQRGAKVTGVLLPLLKTYDEENLHRLFLFFTKDQLRGRAATVTTVKVDIPHESRPMIQG